MKRRFTSILLFATLLVGGASTFVSCKDYESDAAYEASGKYADAVEAQRQSIGNINAYLEQLKKYVKENGDNKGLIDAIDAQIEKNKQSLIDAVKDDILGAGNTLEDAIQGSNAFINISKTIYGDKATGDKGLKEILDELDKTINGVAGNSGLTDRVTTLETKLRELKVLEGSDTLNLSMRIDSLSTRLYKEIDNTKDWVKNQKYLTADDVKDKITLQDVKTWYEQSGINDRLQGMSDSILTLSNSIDDILNKQVSGIVIQGSESPLTGYLKTPFGIEVNTLGAYYGRAEEAWAINGEVFDPAMIMDESDNNAGTIYVTVNPANVNPTGIQLKLVDSQGNVYGDTDPSNEEAPFLLKWANTDAVLTFGGSRAAQTVSNGFYAVNLKLKKEKAEAMKTWTAQDKADLKAAAKNILDKVRQPGTNRLNIGQIAATLNNLFNNRLDAYAIEANWKQRSTTEGKLVDRKVTSEMKLAATAISPLSYTFLQNGVNIDLPRIPTLESKGMTIKDFPEWDPIKGEFKDYNYHYTISVPKATNITIDGGNLTVDAEGNLVYKDNDPTKEITGVTVEVNGITWKNANVKYDTEEKNIDITVSMEQFNKVIDDLNSQVENLLSYANSKINKYNKFAATIDKNYISRINGYIQRFENLLRKPNTMIQPALFGANTNNFWQLATLPGGATQLKMEGGKAETILIATSFTAELLAPAYKKCVKVVEKPSGATVSGDNLGVIIDGDEYEVGFEANKEGIYGIQYEAADYFGKTVKKTYYIKVVK